MAADSIEFSIEGLSELHALAGSQRDGVFLAQPQSLDLVKVRYDIDRSAVEKSVDSLFDRGYWVRMSDCLEILARYKSSAFSEELEWRIITNRWSGHLKREFRAGPTGAVVPFARLFGGHPSAERIVARTAAGTVRSVTVGPSPDQAERAAAVRQLLHSLEHFDVAVRTSEISYRA